MTNRVRIGQVALSYVQGASLKDFAPRSTGAFNTWLSEHGNRALKGASGVPMQAANDPRPAFVPGRPAYHRDLFETILREPANDNLHRRINALLPPVAERVLAARDMIEALDGERSVLARP